MILQILNFLSEKLVYIFAVIIPFCILYGMSNCNKEKLRRMKSQNIDFRGIFREMREMRETEEIEEMEGRERGDGENGGNTGNE